LDQGIGADYGAFADSNAIQDSDGSADPDIVIHDDPAFGYGLLKPDGNFPAIKRMISPGDHVGLAAGENVFPDFNDAFGYNNIIGADIGKIPDLDISARATDNAIPVDDHIAADLYPLIVVSFGIENRIVLEKHIIAHFDFLRVPQGDVLTENNSFAAFFQE